MRSTPRKKILIVDDDTDIVDLLKYNLEKEGYHVKTLTSAQRAISTAKIFGPDLIILDIMMPEYNGIELCRLLRAETPFRNTYIFFLTARSESYYQNAVFHTGGDDFIEKVTGLKALTKKVNAVLVDNLVISKRCNVVQCNDLKLERKSLKVLYRERTYHFSRAEFELLYFLVQNRGQAVAVDAVVNCVWGADSNLAVSSVDVYLQSISRKLGANVIRRTSRNEWLINP